MRCPVCKIDCTGYNSCPNCGFDQLNKVFINSDEANLWKDETVIPYRESFFSSCVGILPFDVLSKEQQKALMLPFDKSCLIVGSAGTGKTTIGLNRAFLTHGKVLYVTKSSIARCLKRELANKAGFGNVQFAEASSVIHEIWKELFDEKMPRKDNGWEPDIAAVSKRVLSLGVIYDCVILDIDAYGAVEYDFLNAISKTIYALIDKNTIVEWLFNLDDFTRSLHICEFAELTQNFRNSRPISCLLSKYKRSDAFSFGTRPGESIHLLRYPKNKEEKYRAISQIVRRNPDQKIGIVVNFSEINELIEYLKTTCWNTKIVNCWSSSFQESILSDEKYIGIASNCDLCNMEFDVAIVMLNDALESMPEIDSANKRCLYQIFSIARNKLYIGISNEIPLKHQGKRILDERNEFAQFVDYKLYEEV